MKRFLQESLLRWIFTVVSACYVLVFFGLSDARAEASCGQLDPDCSKRFGRILAGIHFGEMEVDGGVHFGNGQADGAIRFNVSAASVDVTSGDLDAISFEAVYVPSAGGFRVRFALADSEVLFFCTDDEGNIHPPLTGLMQKCRQEWLGVSGELLGSQWDDNTGRLAMRWAEMNLIINFLRNGNHVTFLHNRLLAFLGTSVDTVWGGSALSGVDQVRTALRLNLGITGTLRTEDNRWEIKGYAGYRPDVIAWDDWGAEARAQVLYHLLLHRNIMGRIGVSAEYSGWGIPWQSLGSFASDRERDSWFVGLMFGVVFQ